MSLIEFLTKESAELVHQHEQLAEISDVFAQIKQLYEKTDVEFKDTMFQTSETSKLAETKKEDDDKTNGQKEQSSQLPAISKQVKAQPLPISKPDEYLPKPVEFTSTRNTRYLETEEYRKELQKQIEEKRRQKRLDEEKSKAEDEALENKLAEQRLKMYLEFMDERRRGEFIAKPKTNSIAANASIAKSDNPSPTKAAQPKQSPSPEDCTAPSTSTNIPTYSNVLSNLNEVRKLIQNDHIEMVERLLNLNVN